eukprot:30497-Pelagococcus_subviridis.AAC.46
MDHTRALSLKLAGTSSPSARARYPGGRVILPPPRTLPSPTRAGARALPLPGCGSSRAERSTTARPAVPRRSPVFSRAEGPGEARLPPNGIQIRPRPDSQPSSRLSSRPSRPPIASTRPIPCYRSRRTRRS